MSVRFDDLRVGDELPTLIERYGDAGALAVAQAMEDAVDEIGTWCATHGVDA